MTEKQKKKKKKKTNKWKRDRREREEMERFFRLFDVLLFDVDSDLIEDVYKDVYVSQLFAFAFADLQSTLSPFYFIVIHHRLSSIIRHIPSPCRPFQFFPNQFNLGRHN